MKTGLLEKKDRILSFLSNISWRKMGFIHSFLLSSKLTENLTLSTVTSTLHEPVSIRRQDVLRVVWGHDHRLSTTAAWVLSPHHLSHCQPGTSSHWRWEEKGTTEDEMVGWHHRLNQWTWVWVNSGSWWWTGRPGVLQSMGLQRVGHNWVTELNWKQLKVCDNLLQHE